MDNIEIVKAYFQALDSGNMDQAGNYLAENYQMVDFTPQPMDSSSMLAFLHLMKAAMPNLQHSLSNIRVEGNVVKLTVQRSGTSSKDMDLRTLGIGIVPKSHKFIIFPNSNYEITVVDGKITTERDVSPRSDNRRMSGLLKAMGVSMGSV